MITTTEKNKNIICCGYMPVIPGNLFIICFIFDIMQRKQKEADYVQWMKNR